MDWEDVGNWLKDNATSGAALVGSLLTGNVPGAIAAGVSLVSGATGHADPDRALEVLQSTPESMIKLRALANEEAKSVREHIRAMAENEAKERIAEHAETQTTIRAGDVVDDRFVRWTRPAQSWVSLGAAIAYVFVAPSPAEWVLAMLLTIPFAYMGLRQFGKWTDVRAQVDAMKAPK